MLRSSIILLSLSAVCLGQYAPTRSAAPTENIPAWYQMSKPAAAPAYPYERRDTYERLDRQPIAQHTNTYAGYPAYPTNRGSSYPDTVPASMASSISALGSPQRRYPPVSSSSTTDNMALSPYETSINRYHKLLLLKKQEKLRKQRPLTTTTSTTSTTTTTTTPSPSTAVPPRSLERIYSTIIPKSSEVNSLSTSGPSSPKLRWKKLLLKSTSTPSTTTTTPTTGSTSLPRFICRHKEIEGEQKKLWRTIAPFRAIDKVVEPGIRLVASTTPTTSTTTEREVVVKMTPEEQAVHVIEFLWPNSELLAAIKDVVAKFKASLDETGIDQDVRLMGNQLRNTWQQLRTGVDRGVKAVKQSAEQSVREMNYGPMNEQIGRLFEKAADATDLRSIRN